MAKQKRKVIGGPEKKKLKVAAAETLPVPDATWDSEEVPERGGVHAVSVMDPELSLEKRVLERKLKKERKKEEKKRLRETGAAKDRHLLAKQSGAQQALDYLCGWAQKRESWRFQKTRQTWLLLHMYDPHKVPEEHFSTLMAYLEGLKGQARELTVQKAEALMQELDKVGVDSPDPLLQVRTWRVRQVLQLLS